MWWINRIYSFVHIPATISFLVGLYWFCVTRTRSQTKLPAWQNQKASTKANPAIYESRRRALAVCNLLAFIVFTSWPCMPPRLLDNRDDGGAESYLDRKFGFVDTVHNKGGAVSVWNRKKYTNQLGKSMSRSPSHLPLALTPFQRILPQTHSSFPLITSPSLRCLPTNTPAAAMPSLHFGYSLMVGLTLMTLPLSCSSPSHKRRNCTFCTLQCTVLRTIGFLYPATILLAIIATANHFIMDALAGTAICLIAWNYNGGILNLLPLEDCVLWCLRVHKPENITWGELGVGLPY